MKKKTILLVCAALFLGILAGIVIGQQIQLHKDRNRVTIIGGSDGPTSIFLAGELANNDPEDSTQETSASTIVESTVVESTVVESTVVESTMIESTIVESTVVESTVVESTVVESTIAENISVSTGRLVVIDPGHQQKGNSEKEPIGPGAEQTKAKVSSGTTGKTSGLAEYQLTLMVSEKLNQELTDRGYQVLMTRTTHDVNISNSERAAIANEAGADAFVRIHANGAENTSIHGAMTLCQTSANPYNGSLYKQSKKLSETVLEGLCNTTGCRKQSIMETDSMSGINWCQIPVTIVEMGYMTNPEEDKNMSTEDYQWKIAKGIADGIDAFFAAQE